VVNAMAVTALRCFHFNGKQRLMPQICTLKRAAVKLDLFAVLEFNSFVD